MAEWVIDASIVVHCDDLKIDWCNTAIAFLDKVYRDGILCLDHGRQIENEYLRNMKSPGHAIIWWQKMVREAGKIQRYDGRVPHRHKNQLVKLGFHNDDLVFIGVAMRSADKKLV